MRKRLTKALIPALAALLAAGAMAVPAGAKKSRGVVTTLFMHGDSVIGEMDSSPQIADVPLRMDPNLPTGTEPKSHAITNGIVTPNHKCAGNTLFPVFVGDVQGRIVGDVTVSLQYLSTPGQVDIRIWTDKFGLLCDSNLSGSAEYPEPAGETTLDLPFGQMGLDAVIEGVDVRATQNLMIQVSPSVAATAPSPAGDVDAYGPFVARVLYDSTLFNSGVTFTCIPPKGKSSCTP